MALQNYEDCTQTIVEHVTNYNSTSNNLGVEELIRLIDKKDNIPMSDVNKRVLSFMKSAYKMIAESNVHYIRYGYFGSVAKNTYNMQSDLDIVLIVSDTNQKNEVSELRCNLECIDCDLAVMLEDNFIEPKTLFHKEVKNSYKEVRFNG